ncbi:hypothetical protein EH244_13930 [Variovorax beijingensis]|uniref:Uncharacterized protein n=1 Tax=Variovorax beijingensis TaxID=2496117 RepID=A0A3P3EQK8_9BURK|nr:hypothetical protein [Variovorax beijingensis]RRH88710.1 hypothetical protein EH244_13930 [Variovorax beijingensis]
MSYRNSSAWIAACVVAALLAACGGGGGGGGGGGLAGFPLPVAGPVTLSGTATYESVPNPSGTLVYASSAPRPVRGAVVEVLNAATSAQLATATTDDNGAYAVSVPANTAIAVRVKAQLVRSGPGASWDVTVRDNTRSGGLYTMQSPTFSSGMVASVRDLHAPSGWGGSSYTGDRVAAPFAILDTVYTAMQKVMSVAPVATFPVLRVFWSPNNAPTRGVINLPAGQIGSTFFVDRGSSGREIYVLGKEDVDTDEYDTSVIAHEWGHYYQSSFSRDDSMGGDHSQSQRTDRRLAFSEGWGNAWSGIALGRRNYVDSGGAQQASARESINIDLSAGAATLPGWYSETSIQSIFWNLNQQVGFKPIHDTLTGFQFRSGAAVTSIHPFSAAFNATAPGSAPALATLLGGQSINATDNDPFGGAETNDGAIPVAIPMYKVAAVGGGVTRACVSNDAGTGNKLGNFSYVRFNAPANRSYQIVVNGGPAGSNPDFDIFRGGLISRTGNTVSLSAGEYVLAVTDLSSLDACFDVSIQ